MRTGWGSALAAALVLVLVLPVPGSSPVVRGQSCLQEAEPNGAPAEAGVVTAPGCASGSLVEDDLADLFIWTLDAAQAGQRWRVAFTSPQGPPAVLAMSAIDPAAEIPTVVGSAVVQLRPGTGSPEPAVTDDLLLPPGRYLLAVTPGAPWTGAPTTYRLDLEPGAQLPPSADEEPNDEPGSGAPLSDAFELSGDAGGSVDHYAWSIGESSEGALWRLEAQGAIGAGPAMTVMDADGTIVADVQAEADGIARAPDLGLAPGSHVIRVTALTAPPVPYILRATREEHEAADPEPNDDPARALPIVPQQLMVGRLARNSDQDAYRLSVDAALGSVLLDARLILRSGPPRRLCLVRLESAADPQSRELSCVEGPENAILSGLALVPGDYLLVVSGAASPLDPYYLRVDPTVAPRSGFELEPNDRPDLATTMLVTDTLTGRLDNSDHVRVQVEGEPQLWEVEARGPDVRLFWVRTDGSSLAAGSDPDGRRERSLLTDAYLIPGDHWFRLDGSGDYELSLSPLGPPVPGGEREPNDELATADVLPMDGSITGRIGGAADTDYAWFSLAATERVRITLEPPPGAELWLYPEGDLTAIASGRVTPAPGEPIDLDLLLPAGDHGVRVVGAATEGRYRLTLSREDPFDLAADQEPNDHVSTAGAVPPDLRIEGSVDDRDPVDWYRLEPLPAAGELSLETDGVIRSLVIHDGIGELPLAPQADGRTYHSLPYPAGASLALGVVAEGAYRIAIEPGTTGLERTADGGSGALPVTVALTAETTEVAAFDPLGQRVRAELSLTNTSAQPVDVTLDAATSQPAWSVAFDGAEATLPGGGSLLVPVAIDVPAQAASGTPVRVTVRARDGERQATSHVEIEPRAEAGLVSPSRWWAVPEALLGGLDAASTGLGAVPIASIDPAAQATLHDGVVALGSGMDVTASLPMALAVDLAGDEPVPVAGTILDPTAGPGPVAGTVRDFELLLSMDGITYETALTGSLSGARAEQAFVLPAPVMARFAQLRVTTTHPGSDYRRLGEWKVVASPGWQPAPEPLNIAAPVLGGHITWLDPQPGSPLMLDEMLTEDDPLPGLLGFDGTRTSDISWAMGFQDGRAAQVTELQWVDHTSPDLSLRLRRLELAMSMEGPLGPWTPLGTWDLERDASGAVAPFRLEVPVWTRYLRMSAPVPDRDAAVVELPQAVRVLEREPSEDYRTVAGEWGYARPEGPFEWQEPLDPASIESVPQDQELDEPGPDLPLEHGSTVEGRVSRGRDSDAYVVRVPDGQHGARIVVSGRPTVGVALSLFDESGAEIPMSVRPGQGPGTVEHEAAVTPGAGYRLLVEQPPFSVVVAYDTSTSVGQYLPLMAAALRSYVAGMVPGEEVAQLLDFEAQPVPDEFSDDPWQILNALDGQAGYYTGSSSAEIGLIDATDLLAGREGTRAILLMTDAESPSFAQNTEAWRWLSLVRPRIFSVHVVGAATPVQDQRLMQGWAASTAGFYAYARSGAAIGEAFERMSTWLRRPADYSLRLELSADPPVPPEPGSVRVVSDPNASLGTEPADAARGTDTSAVALELVLDTSGSMLERMGRRRRIDVAKTVLGRLVAERMQPGTPVALRVFRQERRSCESELAVPLQPLVPATMVATIEDLSIQRSVRTPLAAAISAVADDLAGVTGPRIVVIISDGEESCDGEPEAAVQALVEQGFDVTVNVVGMGLDRQARRRIGRLAEIGGGTYYDARDADGLSEALRGALGAPYVVFDESGAEVARGTVDGDPVGLPPGTYRIALVGASESLDVVVIESGRQATVVAPSARQAAVVVPSAGPA